MDPQKTGRFIAVSRKKKDLTQEQLAEKINTSSKTVSRWETGSKVDYIYLKDLSRALGVTEMEIIKGESDEKEITLGSILKRHPVLTIFVIVIVLVVIVIMVMRNVVLNNFETYAIKSNNQDYLIKGLIVNTPVKDTLIINSIENVTDFDMDLVNVYTYQYSLYSNNTVIYSMGDIGQYQHDQYAIKTPMNEVLKDINLYIEENHNLDLKIKKEYLSNLHLEIIYLDENLDKNVLILPLKIIRTFVNNKIFYNGGEQF